MSQVRDPFHVSVAPDTPPRGYAPGWVARCPHCPYETDLASLGWIRVGAYSWGKRHSIYCPSCGRKRSMRIIHVDENGNPDQSFLKVLAMVLLMQAAIATVVVAILAAVGVIPLWLVLR